MTSFGTDPPTGPPLLGLGDPGAGPPGEGISVLFSLLRSPAGGRPACLGSACAGPADRPHARLHAEHEQWAGSAGPRRGPP